MNGMIIAMKPCLAHWPEIAARIQAARGVFVAFDYDGVLSPIAPRPDFATLSIENRILLDRLARHPGMHVAVVSGRSLADVRKHIDLDSLFYAGNHGAEISFNGKAERHIDLELYRAALVKVKGELGEWLLSYPGGRLEDKGFGIGVHYREVAPQRQLAFQRGFDLWAKNLPADLRVLPAKMMFEVRPKVDWNKGNAVLRLWQALAPDSLPFCLGDDRTDEDGFMALRGKGINIFVGAAQGSSAEYFLPSTREVTTFIERLLAAADQAFGPL